MKKVILSALFVLLSVGTASWSLGQDGDEAACTQAIQTNCTSCHGTKKICKELGKADADWGKIMTSMAKKGKLSQEVHDTVLNCLTKSADPAKLVCEK